MILVISSFSPAKADVSVDQTGTQAESYLKRDASTEDIFRALFGRKPLSAPRLKYPVVLLGENRGDIEVLPRNDQGETEIDIEALIALVAPLVLDERLDELEALSGGQTTVTTTQLVSLGYKAYFDPSNLRLEVDVPVEFRSIVPIPLQQRRRPVHAADIAKQAETSVIANVFAGATYVHNSTLGPSGMAASQVNIDVAANHRGLVLETGLRYVEDSEDPITLSDTRFTYDLVGSLIRLEAGDLTVPTSGLQGNPSIAGLSSYRNFNLRPDENFRANPSQAFELQRAARVSVFINGQFIRELRLPSGRYNLTDLPLRASSGNDVVLEILYDTGEIERIVFAAFYDFNLLREGVSQFAFSAGPRSEIRNGRRSYDTDNIAFSGFYRLGVSDRVTIGVNTQLDNDLVNFGSETLFATRIGSIGLLGNYSDHTDASGAAVTGFYRWAARDPKRQITFEAQTSYQDQGFRSLGSTSGSVGFKYDTAIRLAGNASEKLRLQISGGHRRRYESPFDELSITFSGTRRLGRGSFGATVRYDEQAGRSEWSAGISYTARFGPVSTQLAHETRRKTSRATFAVQANTGANSFGYDVAYTAQSFRDELRAGFGYIGNRFDGRIEQTFAQIQPGGSLGEESFTNLFLGSAFVYADGATAFSRPVVDSFAIFKTASGAEMFDIAVDPGSTVFGTKRSYAAKSSALGPAVLPDLQSYYPRTVQVEAPDAPGGISIGNETYSFRPGLRSGHVVKVGTDRNVSVVGVLVDMDGNPVPFASGFALVGDGERRATFSNSGGRFFVDGLKAGENVRLEFDTPGEMVAEMRVPEGALGLVRLDQHVVLEPVSREAELRTARLVTAVGED
jgi:outer membrane usher protein